MRWPFRRRGGDAPAPVTSTPDVPPVAAVPPRPAGRQWVTLPPLPITITPAAPLVASPPPVQPPLLTHPTVPRHAQAIPPATGRVEGLATVAPRVEEPPAPPVVATVAEPVRPLVHRRVRSGSPVDRAAMVEAVGGYVGEPREPAVPHRAPGWMRYVPEWLSQSTPDPDPVPSAPEPVAKPDFLRPPPEPKKKVVEAARQDTVDAERPDQPKRRPTLGQTRRLGLGAPLRHRPDEQVATAEPSEAIPAVPEPAPAPPAPVAEVAESTEETDDEPAAEPPPPRPEPPPLLHPRPAEAVTPPRPEPPPPPAATPAQPVYRSAPGRPGPRPAVVPTDLASALRGPHPVDVSAIPVHRGPTVSAEARSLGARAFTRGGEVFLPDEVGPIDSPKARGLLAHELVHAVQQRTLGHALPSSSTVAGAQLEAEAVAVEHQHSGHSAPPMVHPSVPRMLNQAAQAAGVQLAPLIPDSVIPAVIPAPVAPAAAPAVSQAASAVDTLTAPVRQEVGDIAQATAGKVFEQWTNPALGGTGFGAPGAAAGGGSTPANLVPGGIPSGLGLPGGHSTDAVLLNAARQVLAAGGAPTGPTPAAKAPATANQHAGLDSGTGVAGLLGGLLTGGPEALVNDVPDLVAQHLQQALAGTSGTGIDHDSLLGRLGELINGSAAQQTSSEGPVNAARLDSEGKRLSLGEAMANSFVPGLFDSGKPAAAEESTADKDDQDVDLSKIDMEELSARLYDRLRSRLRLELLIDRERAGLLTDFR